jgi:uncharacterized protein
MARQLRIVDNISRISPADWNRCAASASASTNPFLQHDFLAALEDSGSATPETGWAPQHLVLEVEGKVAAVAPCYLKFHSQGEYVFDHGWAEAFQRAGGKYYPKLQIAVPFTPVTGPRLLAATPQDRALLAAGAIEFCASRNMSSVHITFVTTGEGHQFADTNWLLREDTQFHWHNQNFGNYGEFLATLSSAKRKALRKERKAVSEMGISFEHLTGQDLTETHWDHFYEFYMDTGSRKWGRPYLTRRFFSLVSERMASSVLLVLAIRNGKYIAGALNFVGSDTIFGRNWGCIEHHPFLHFETCYYQAQDFAIARGLKTVEAGAQGEHKLSRGYLPVKTQSLHYLAHPGLRKAVANYLEAERQAVAENQSALNEHAPFRKGTGNENDL